MANNLRPMAITHLSRRDIEQRLGLIFKESEDVLGKVSLGIPQNSSLGLYNIRIYETSPKPSTEILLGPETASVDLDRILTAMGINRDDLFWVHPKAGGSLRRHVVDILHAHLEKENPLIQIVVGPRQVGKTTAVQHLMKEWPKAQHYANADAIVDDYGPWLELQWQKALTGGDGSLLVIDEIQKIKDWTELVKKLWDKSKKRGLRVVLLGSTSLDHCLSSTMAESLSGRFMPIFVPHWSFAETQEAFGSDLEEYTLYGGYPKAMEFSKNLEAWYNYVGKSIINPIIDVDIFQQGNFRNIENLRRAFRVFCRETNLEINFTSILGEIQKSGNTEMVKKYLAGFTNAFLLTPIYHVDANEILDTRRNPKIMLNCPAVFTFGRSSTKKVSEDAVRFDQIVAGELSRMPHTLFGYWQESDEIGLDYFIKTEDDSIFGVNLEGRDRSKRLQAKSYDKFRKTFKGARIASISPDNLPQFMTGQRAYLEMAAL